MAQFQAAVENAKKAMQALAVAIDRAELEEIAPGLSIDNSGEEFEAFMRKLL